MKKIGLIVVALSFLAAPAFAADYMVDKSHTSIGFSVNHMVISNVKGNFGDFAGTFTFDDKSAELTKVDAVIKTASIATNDPKRDEYLRSPDFLDAAKYPDMTFKLTKAESLGGGKMKATGNLTIHGVTKEVTLEGEYTGTVMKDPMGMTRSGFTASGVINRGDFGLTWNKLFEAGGFVVGDEVELLLEVEGVQAKPAPANKKS